MMMAASSGVPGVLVDRRKESLAWVMYYLFVDTLTLVDKTRCPICKVDNGPCAPGGKREVYYHSSRIKKATDTWWLDRFDLRTVVSITRNKPDGK